MPSLLRPDTSSAMLISPLRSSSKKPASHARVSEGVSEGVSVCACMRTCVQA